MKFIIQYLTIKNLILIIIILFLLYILTKKVINFRYEKPEKTSSDNVYLYYLDKYYVSNLYLTMLNVFIYISIHISFLLFFRYYYLGSYGDVIFLPNSVISFKILIMFMLTIILFIVALVLIYALLDLVFFSSVLKLFLYLNSNIYVYNICFFMMTKSISDFFGPLYLFFDNIVKNNKELTYNDYYDHYMYTNIYENLFIKNLNILCIQLCHKFSMIRIIFILFKHIMQLLYVHFNLVLLNILIPNVMLVFSVFYDLIIIQKFHYVYIILFILSIYRLCYKIYTFVQLKQDLYNDILYDYFYKNSISYEKILKNSNRITWVESKETYRLLNELKDDNFKTYVTNNLAIEYSTNSIKKNISAMYKRFTYLTIFLIFSFYFIQHYFDFILIIGNQSVPSIILILPISLMYYFHKNAFKHNPDVYLEYFYSYVYKRKYAILFWLLALIQSYIFFLLIFKV